MRIMLLISLYLLLFSCSHLIKTDNLIEGKHKCTFHNHLELEELEWICNPKQNTDLYFAAVGETVREGGSFGFAIQEAVLSARSYLLQNIQEQLRENIKNICARLGIAYENIETLLYSSSIMADELKTTKIYKQHTIDNNHIYLLVGYLKASYLEYVKNIITKSYKAERLAWDTVLGEHHILYFQKLLLEELE